MGIEEQILQMKRTEGRVEGKVEEVSNLITKLGLNDEQAADVAGVRIEFMQQVRANLENRGSKKARPD